LYAASQAIIEAISNDLGTPEALRIIDETFNRVQNVRLMNLNHQTLIKFLSTIDYTLGLQLVESTPDISDDIKHTIFERNSARETKDWDRADELRDKLLKLGIVLRDSAKGSIWEYAN
jgi:cysteinyl-tRNA synthetase